MSLLELFIYITLINWSIVTLLWLFIKKNDQFYLRDLYWGGDIVLLALSAMALQSLLEISGTLIPLSFKLLARIKSFTCRSINLEIPDGDSPACTRSLLDRRASSSFLLIHASTTLNMFCCLIFY